ncbi:MAG: serine/threonine-protein kinase [Microthrixaceae bacterium]
MTPERPHLIGLPTRIRLIEQVGAGSSGTVWRARDSHSGSDFAIKILSIQHSDALATERMEREARALSRLTQVDGAISLHQVGRTADGTAWLMLDFASAGSLRDRIDQQTLQQVEKQQALVQTLANELFATLAQAHESGVIHGDISPANVLFSESGRPLLADFGMASLLGGGVGAEGIVGFTPAYGAPELFSGRPPDQASDVFSLAATLWHAEFGVPLRRGPQGEVLTSSHPNCDAPSWMIAALAEQPRSRPDARSMLQQLSPQQRSHKPWFGSWKYPRKHVE